MPDADKFPAREREMIDKNGEKINNNLIILSSNVQFCEGSIFADIILDINRFYLKNTVLYVGLIDCLPTLHRMYARLA